jgi:aminotransferase in exopolysaccharide biosynthesis
MLNQEFVKTADFIKSLYPNDNPVPLHAPRFTGNEKAYLCECIDSTYVSYVGRFVTDFEEHIKITTGSKNAIAIVNGTSAIHMTLLAAGVQPGELVITQALTFAATAAGIRHANAEPVFIDVDKDTLGMSPDNLENFLKTRCEKKTDGSYEKYSGKKVAAVMPMHTFGFPCRIDEIKNVCDDYNIQLIEDAAESLGSAYKEKATGTFGRAAILSFNGNKTITTGGGGMIITDDDALAQRVRHISTTAKSKHRWEFFHDEVGYNLRMPNVNAAIGCAQMENFDRIIENKRSTAKQYIDFFKNTGIEFIEEPKGGVSNYWLNCILLKDRFEREAFLQYTNDNGVQTRPIWILMSKLPPYKDCIKDGLDNSIWLEDRVVNIPSSVRS